MRTHISKRSSTKPERIFMEIMKKHHVPFKHRAKVLDMEIDFIVDNYAIEIDGHQQDSRRNKRITEAGYQVLHYHNNALLKNRSEVEKDLIIKLQL